MPTKTMTISRNSLFINEELNNTLSDLQIETVQEEKYFIPIIIEINGVRVPSIPFYSNNDNLLFLGDVFEVRFDGFGVETYLIELKNGQYVGTSSDPFVEEPLWLFDKESITNLGSSIKRPELLNKLS